MKKHLLLLSSAFFLLLTYTSIAQISNFPYTEDFENPSSYQAVPASCDITTAGPNFPGWTQDPNDNGDWRVDTAGTTSIGTGPGAGRIISGVGIGTDANPGTTRGAYLYTEATNATTCGGSVISILSPFFDFSATGKYYQAKLNYHMLGLGMGTLNVDARQGINGTWSNGLLSISGEQDSAWLLDSINLAGFSGDSVQLRIRAIMGTNYLSDLAFDNLVIDTFSPALADAILIEARITNLEYPIIPQVQFDSLEFSAGVRNEGLANITQTTVSITENTFISQVSLDTISPFTSNAANANNKYFAQTAGIKDFMFEVSTNEVDANYANNKDTVSIEVTDTVMARENLNATVNGIGSNNGVLEIGQRFTLNTGDTATSISFYVSAPTAGDSVIAHIRAFNQVPGAIIESSVVVNYVAGQNWYTAPLECFSILPQGDYFISVEQLVLASNMSLGYTDLFFKDSTSFYGAPGTWATLESVGFSTSQMIRLNFGHYDTYRDVNISSNLDTICEGGQVIMAGDATGSYSWTPANLAFAPLSQTSIFSFDNTTIITATVDFGCGLSASDTMAIQTTKSPTSGGTNDTTICNGASITLRSTGGSSYRWIGGPTNQDWLVTPTSSPQTYNSLIDSSNGCQSAHTVVVITNSPSIAVFGDTAVCTGENVTVSAAGSATYQWQDGPSDSAYSFDVTETKHHVVTAINQFGCISIDSVLVTENQAPELVPMNDTGACVTKFITLKAGGTADTYLWSDGSTSDSIRYQLFTAKTYTLIAENINGCKSYDTVVVDRYLRPNGTITPANDLLICEGTSIDIVAGNGVTYEWSTGETTATISPAPTEPTKYDVIIRSAEGCEDYKEVTISLDPLPITAFRYQDFLDSVVFINQSSLATSYTWDFGDGNSSIAKDPFNIYDSSGKYTVTLSATNDCGTVDSSITIDITVPIVTNGINDITTWNDVQLYPVPVTDRLNVRLENQLFGDVNIRLYDIAGKLISSKVDIKSTKQFTQFVSLNGLEAGVYTLQISIDTSTIRSKITKH
mgnify:CR=1 FL=1